VRVRNRYGELLRQWQTGNFSQLSVRRRGEAGGSHYFWLATPSSFRHTAFAGSRDEAVFNSCVWYSLCKSCCKSWCESHTKGGLKLEKIVKTGDEYDTRQTGATHDHKIFQSGNHW